MAAAGWSVEQSTRIFRGMTDSGTTAGRARSRHSRMESGARGSGPAIALRPKARSATERPRHPDVLKVDHANAALGLGTRPIEGRKPAMLQNAAGLRSEPPVSEPLATGVNPHTS